MRRILASRAVWNLMEENAEFREFVSKCLSHYLSQDQRIEVYYIPDEIENTFENQLWIIDGIMMFMSDLV